MLSVASTLLNYVKEAIKGVSQKTAIVYFYALFVILNTLYPILTT
jgi:uncharacterized ion transporter superfamily protein YfcC